GQRYDLILDIAGRRSVSHLRRALAPRGTLVFVGGEGGGRWFGGIDLSLSGAGRRSVSPLRRALAPRGALVFVGGEGGGRWFGGIDRQLGAQMLSPFVSQKLGTFVAKPNSEKLMTLKELIEAGKVTAIID